MKTTRYFLDFARLRHPEAQRNDWVESVLSHPLVTDTARQPMGRIAWWGYIDEVGRYMRVVTEPDGETVHNAFFDRNYAKKVGETQR